MIGNLNVIIVTYFVYVITYGVKDNLAANIQNHYGFHPVQSGPHKTQIDPQSQRHSAPHRRSSDVLPDAQRFFPSFSQLFEDGPSFVSSSRQGYYEDSIFRPSFRTQEFNPNSFREQRELFSPPVSPPIKDLGMLGSGNFGVIRGGTYYAEDREDGEYALDSDLFPFYDGNGHGRPPYFRGNPKPLYKNGGNFFENFRDFADITPPTKSFSEFYVVYVNQNATEKNPNKASIVGPEDSDFLQIEPEAVDEGEGESVVHIKKGPKNILEQLAMLDETNSKEKESQSKSKSKQKLSEHKKKESIKESRLKAQILQTPKNPYDPLLALS